MKKAKTAKMGKQEKGKAIENQKYSSKDRVRNTEERNELKRDTEIRIRKARIRTDEGGRKSSNRKRAEETSKTKGNRGIRNNQQSKRKRSQKERKRK